ncbi:MAG: hypothetical protein ABL955_03395 [Elusimicrobiota bacterium]
MADVSRRCLRIFLVSTLLYGAGVQWLVLQGTAWTGMLVARTGASTLREAIVTTFDGSHPCRMCRFVQKQAGTSDQMPRTTGSTLSADLAAVSGIVVSAPGVSSSWPHEEISHRSRVASPPVAPPPKSFLPA